MSNIAKLETRAIIAVGGEEAEHFLHNLVTCDVEGLKPGEAAFGALLTPQGKILFDFLALRADDSFLIDVAADQADDLAKRLVFYRLRAKVDIEKTDDAVHVIWPGEDEGFADPRNPELGVRTVTPLEANSDEAAWDAHRIRLGFAECGKDFEPADVFPHEALMDHFGRSGVDFSKGCFVGQEVVSRMQHRGTARSRFVKVAADAEQDLPAMGTDVKAGDVTLGKTGSHSGSNGLALLRLDRTAAALRDGQDITADGLVIKPTLPDFATFDWPE